MRRLGQEPKLVGQTSSVSGGFVPTINCVADANWKQPANSSELKRSTPLEGRGKADAAAYPVVPCQKVSVHGVKCPLEKDSTREDGEHLLRAIFKGTAHNERVSSSSRAREQLCAQRIWRLGVSNGPTSGEMRVEGRRMWVKLHTEPRE
jgi:hypothetical protein